MKKYVVQCKYPDGEVGLSVNTPNQIIDMVGYSDCSGCEYAVFAGDDFGKLVQIVELTDSSEPTNYHMFYNMEKKIVEFFGYSPEH